MNPVRSHESAARKLVRLGLPLLVVGALLLAFGAVLVTHRSSSQPGDSGDAVAGLSELEARLAAHRDKLEGLSAAHRDAKLAAAQLTAEQAAAAAGDDQATGATEPERHGHHGASGASEPSGGSASTETRADQASGDGRITLDCDVHSPLGCMDD